MYVYRRATWDFDEYTERVSFTRYDNSRRREVYVFVLKKRTVQEMIDTALVLFAAEQITHEAQEVCRSLGNNRDHASLFARTAHTFYEIEDNDDFVAVNKPKNVHVCSGAEPDRPRNKDGVLRAHERYVMLSTRVLLDDYGSLLSTLIHELAHTLCNHVRFRTDDHGDDFREQERFLKTTVFGKSMGIRDSATFRIRMDVRSETFENDGIRYTDGEKIRHWRKKNAKH